MLDRLLGALGFPAFAQAMAHERLLIVLILAVAALFVLTVLFAFVAVALRLGHARVARRERALAARWEELVLEISEGGVTPAVSASRVAPGDELAFLDFLLRFARRVRGGEFDRLTAAAAPYVDRAVAELKNRSPERRAQAVQVVAAFGMPRHAPDVVAALDDPSPYVAVTAAQALATREHAVHAPHVLRRLSRFLHWSADYLSAMIARIGPVAAAPARQLLGDAAAPAATRAVAADALTRLNDPEAADVAARVLEQARDQEGGASAAPLQAACLRVLAQVGGGEAKHARTVRPFTRSPHGLVRSEAVRALAALGGEQAVGELRDALRDASPWVARQAARGLMRLGHADVLEEIGRAGAQGALVAQQVLAEGTASRGVL